MADRFAGARLKLARAEEHFGALNEDHERFKARNPYRALRETDGKDHHFLWRVKVVEEPPFERWGAMAGDCVHCLRSALDHVAYTLVNTPNFKTEKTSFPILDDKTKWASSHRGGLPGVRATALSVIESIQPYHGVLAEDPLWGIHMLDIVDKHRRLPIVTSLLNATWWDIQGGTIEVLDPSLGPFVDGGVLGRFRIDSEPNANVTMQTTFDFGIAFGPGVPCEGKPVIPTLEWWRVYVGGVISKLEPRRRRTAKP